jgi:hypothetical protein
MFSPSGSNTGAVYLSNHNKQINNLEKYGLNQIGNHDLILKKKKGFAHTMFADAQPSRK